MKCLYVVGCFLLLNLFSFGQTISYSAPLGEDNRNMNFEIIGKLQGNMLVFKNVGNNYRICVYDNDMQLKERVKLDFIPNSTLNVDFVAYQDFFYLIYQFTKRGIVYCNAAKLDASANIINQPITLDTTRINIFQEDRIYSTINSENKQRIMVMKVQKKSGDLHYTTLLYDNQLQLLHRTFIMTDFDERREVFSDFALSNEGNLAFTRSYKYRNHYNASALNLIMKAAESDSFTKRKIDLSKNYINEVTLKIDNINKKYLLNSFYVSEKRGNVDGIHCAVWDVSGDSCFANSFTPLSDSLKETAKLTGRLRDALNDFYIRNILVKKDGSYLLTAENYSTEVNGVYNDRWNSMYNSPFSTNSNYYYYNQAYSPLYRPINNFNNTQSKKYNYDNIIVLNIAKNGIPSWSNVINKEQNDVDNDNYLSYGYLNAGGEIHFMFNNSRTNDDLLYDHSVSVNGIVKRNPSIKTAEKGYNFMPRFGKQVSAREIIIPCTFKTQIAFAKITY